MGRQALAGSSVARAGAAVLLAMLVTASLTGCDAATGSEQTPVAGAQSTVVTGPTAVVTPTLPTLLPRVTASAQAAPIAAARLQALAAQITSAIARAGRASPHVQVSNRASAGKIIVSWIVNTDPGDTAAKAMVRPEALKIMALVKASGIDGSVQLSATGSSAANVDKRVLWARFSRGTMRKTDWAAVSPASIFTLCEKPALIEPGFG